MGIIAKKEKKSVKETIREFPSEVKKEWKKKLLYLLIAPAVVIVDQTIKSLVVAFIPLHTALWGEPYEGILRIIHVRNTAIAFGMGGGLHDTAKTVLFILLPLAVVIGLFLYSLGKNGQPAYQRVAFSLIIGGGLGNILDRIFRPDGVVDFIDTWWFGVSALSDIPLLKLLSYSRWPTWNFADACVVAAVVLLLAGTIVEEIQMKRNKKRG